MVLQREEHALIRTQAGTFELVEEHRNGWNLEVFLERYCDILDKYDYIVGDWGYGQLRLRGFYGNFNRKVPFEQRIAFLDEYLQEFCNFGCAYFVLRRLPAADGERKSAAGREKQTYGAEAESNSPEQLQSFNGQRFHSRGERDRQIRPRGERGVKQPPRFSRGDVSDRQQLRKEEGDNGMRQSPSPHPRASGQRERVRAAGFSKKNPQN